MKALKFVIYAAAVSLSLSAGLVACGKTSNDDGKTLQVGSLNSDGNAVTSTTTIGGYQVNLTIDHIAGQSNACGFYGCQTSLNFTVILNNSQQMLNYQPQFNQTQNQRRTGRISGFDVLYQAACYDQTCATVAVEVIIGTGYDYRQIVIKKDMSANKVTNMGEWNVNGNTVLPLTTIMKSL